VTAQPQACLAVRRLLASLVLAEVDKIS